MQADYVIIGAGSAGCVLANRLTEDPATRVILIEAGRRDWNPLIHIPVGYMKLLDHKQLTWGFKAEADPGTNGRAIAYPRGRVLGPGGEIYVQEYFDPDWRVKSPSEETRQKPSKRPLYKKKSMASHPN
jgi:choline dehydrogenase-like flavoprotein